ncbi:hypothetical protein C8J57DRAFT_114218 [Mycena rebaudengoi]|nr:hypothetical protein C8J57DRAFT_114218 [Mycena rebaudengoi]
MYDDDAAYGDVLLSPLVVVLPSPSSESASASESAPSTPASAVFDDRAHFTDALDELEYASGSEYGYGYGYNEGGDDAESDWEPSPSYGHTGWHTRPAPSSSTAFTPPQQQLKSRWSSSMLSSVRSAQAVHSPKLGGFAIARRYFPLSTSPKSSSKAKVSASSTNASPTSGRKSLNLRLGGGKKFTTADVLVVGRPPATPSLLGGVVDVFSAPSLSPSITPPSRKTRSPSRDCRPRCPSAPPPRPSTLPASAG